MIENLLRQKDLEPNGNSVCFIILKPLGGQEPLRTKILEKIGSISNIDFSIKHKATKEEVIELYKSGGFDENGEPKQYLLTMAEHFHGKEIELLVVSSRKSSEELMDSIRDLIGNWNPMNSKPGQIRHLMVEAGIPYDSDSGYDNLIHSSETQDSLLREMRIWFSESEIKNLI